jgi:transcriptional regulator with XRE-family HTH domain
MAAVLPPPLDPSRKALQAILRRLARMSLSEIAAAIQKDESTASRLRSGEAKLTVEEFAALIAAIGCKLVDQRKTCVDPEVFESVVHINMRAMRNEQTVRALLTDDDPE